MSDPERAWQHPYLRLSYLIRTILGVRWDAARGPRLRPPSAGRWLSGIASLAPGGS